MVIQRTIDGNPFFTPEGTAKQTISFLSLQFYHWIMNGLHRLSLHHLFVLLVIISGSALPAINFARYCRKISVNLTGRRNSADDRMRVTQNQIRNISQKEYPFVDLQVCVKTQKKEILIPALLEPGSYKLFTNLIQNSEQKTFVTWNNWCNLHDSNFFEPYQCSPR